MRPPPCRSRALPWRAPGVLHTDGGHALLRCRREGCWLSRALLTTLTCVQLAGSPDQLGRLAGLDMLGHGLHVAEARHQQLLPRHPAHGEWRVAERWGVGGGSGAAVCSEADRCRATGSALAVTLPVAAVWGPCWAGRGRLWAGRLLKPSVRAKAARLAAQTPSPACGLRRERNSRKALAPCVGQRGGSRRSGAPEGGHLDSLLAPRPLH